MKVTKQTNKIKKRLKKYDKKNDKKILPRATLGTFKVSCFTSELTFL